ncbi:unnamed protein product [Adineta steineri]|uniref:Uncharacterized protein n=2 Tax=Adineta steineri TaxID=433720 RepID=A0A818N116_9BILA|nr:unnamed protein product [Adineta steineri]
MEVIVNELMIEDWSPSINFSDYFLACAPKICTYTLSGRHNLAYVITTLTGLYGGLIVAFRFIVLFFIKRIRNWRRRNRINYMTEQIGNAIGDYSQALQYYTKALHCNNDQPTMARIQVNIAVIHANNKKYGEAIDLCIKAREILQQIYPQPYDNIIYVQGILGHCHAQNKEYQIAEDYYVAAFKMSKKILSIGHRLRVNCIKALADLYKEREMKQMAIDLCQKNLFLYKKYLPAYHISIAYLLVKLGELYEDDDIRKIASLRRALRIFERSLFIEYVPTANCLLMIAEYYKNQNGYDSASKYYNRALKIQEKIYPNNHSIILQTQSLIAIGQNQS